MTIYTRRPERFHATVLTEGTTTADLQALYNDAGQTGTVTVTPVGGTIIVQTTGNPGWTGVFTAGDLVRVSENVFTLLEPADDYAPYDSIYVAS